MTRRVLTLIWAFMALNAIWLGLASWARLSPPSHEVMVTARSDAIVLYGLNRFGLLRIVLFRRWDEAQDYMKAHHLELPRVSFAERGQANGVHWESLPRHAWPTQVYKVKWVAWDGMPGVIFTPDEPSARAFAQYVQYQNLTPAYLGFSVNITN